MYSDDKSLGRQCKVAPDRATQSLPYQRVRARNLPSHWGPAQPPRFAYQTYERASFRRNGPTWKIRRNSANDRSSVSFPLEEI